MDVEKAASLYRVLGEDVRLRLLRVLARERLNVTELTGVLGLAQSGVSRHLGLLKDAGLVAEEPAGGFTFYRLAPALQDGPLSALWRHLHTQFDLAASSPEARADDARLQEMLQLRRENFETHGNEAGQLVPGRSWAAWARALGHLCRRWTSPTWAAAKLSDGGGGTVGTLVVAVDHWRRCCAGPRARRKRGLTNIVWKRGDIEHAPIATGASTWPRSPRSCTTRPIRPSRWRSPRILRPTGRVDSRPAPSRAGLRSNARRPLARLWERPVEAFIQDAGFDEVRLRF